MNHEQPLRKLGLERRKVKELALDLDTHSIQYATKLVRKDYADQDRPCALGKGILTGPRTSRVSPKSPQILDRTKQAES